MRYIISGGGTGGHIYPALAIVEEIKRQDEEAEILYVGTKNGLEAELVPKAGVEFDTVRVKWLPRKINIEFFKSLIEVFKGLKDARKIIKEFKPDISIGTGGYVSGPVLLMSKLTGVPTLIHEQNAFPGITSKILGRFVNKIAVTFEESKKYFKNDEKIIVTGNPIRYEILNINREKAYEDLKIDSQKPFILSFGGSGGQTTLNEGIIKMIKNEDLKDYQMIHVTGNNHYDSFMNDLGELAYELPDSIRIVPYMYNMPEALNIADLVITSAGAISLAEISAIGIASILIPKAYSAENHQEYNARAFEKVGASKVILENDLNYEVLKDTIIETVEDRDKLVEMANNSKKLGNAKATENIVTLIRKLASDN